MTVSRTVVRYDPDTKAFDASARRIEGELDLLTRKANAAIQRTQAARATAVGHGAFRLKRNKAEFGPLELGARGLQLNNGFMRGAFGRSVGVGLGLHIVGAGLNTLADVNDRVAEIRAHGGTAGEVARSIGGSAAKSVVETVGALTGLSSVVRGISRFIPAGQVDDAARRFEDIFKTREEIARREEAERKAKALREQAIDTVYAESLGRLDAALPKTFRLKTSADVTAYRQALKFGRSPGGFSNTEIADLERKAARSKADLQAVTTEGR